MGVMKRAAGMGIRITGEKALQKNISKMHDKMQRKVIRGSMVAAAKPLIKQIRLNIDAMISKNSASLGGQVRFNSEGKKTSLKKSIGRRAWSKPRRGLIGQAVGPRWPEGAHGHLVEKGHAIWMPVKQGGGGYAAVDTGKRSRPIPFQARAEIMAASHIHNASVQKAKQLFLKLK